MVSIGIYVVTVLVALALIIAVYFIGENRGKAAVAVERAKLDSYRIQLSGYLERFGGRINEEAKAHFVSLYGAPPLAPVDVHRQYGYPVVPGMIDDDRRGVETHWLAGEQGAEVFAGVI